MPHVRDEGRSTVPRFLKLLRRQAGNTPRHVARGRHRLRLGLESLEGRLVMDGGGGFLGGEGGGYFVQNDLDVTIAFSVENDWQTGFTGKISITNRGTQPISGWTMQFDFAPTIDSIWNAVLGGRVGTRYTVRDAGYNKTIAPGNTISYGFNGSPGKPAAPTNYVFNGVPVGGSGGGGGGGGGQPTLSIASASVNEGNSGTTPLAFTLTLNQASTTAVSVGYATSDATARAGLDYQSSSGAVTFAPGETTKPLVIPILGDTIDETDESFNLLFSNVVGAILASNSVTGTIVDDDSPAPPTFNFGEALQKSIYFYEAQRSGDLPANYRVEWRGDSGLGDGSDVGVDLRGGFYDAGDHVKFGFPMAGSMTLLSWGAIEYQDAYARSGQLDYLLETLRWGADYLVKCHTAPNEFWGQVGRGDLDHASWIAPEVMTMARPAYKIDSSRPGSDLAGEAAAALASASLVFRSTDPAYAANLLAHAEQLYRFADSYRGKYSESIPDAANYYNSYSGYDDELVWGAAWLFKATGNAAYLAKAESLYAQKFAGQTMTWTHSWDDKRYGAAVLLAQLTGKDVYKRDVERWLDYWSVGINGGSTRIAYTPGGLAFLNGWGSLRYASTTAFLALVYSDTVRDVGSRYHDFAVGQISYILGANPSGQSYVVGYGVNSPRFPHHRGASGVWDGNVSNPTANRHILQGALVGGPESADDGDYHDVRSNYISNEVALDYNAGFTGALARLYREYGGDPLASFPSPEARDREYFVEASVNQQSATFTEFRALLNNRSAWPARMSQALSFRYFVNLSEVLAAGYGISDVQVGSSYSQGASISGLIPWNAAEAIYYVDVRFTGVTIGPGAATFSKEAQVRVGLRSGLPASAWNPANDWSYQGLAQGRDAIAYSPFLPVYEFSTTKLSGQTPAEGSPSVPSISVEDATVTEGNLNQTTPGVFTVRLSSPSATPVSVSYATSNVTAQAGLDYTASSGVIQFAAGEITRTISVPVLGDVLVEGRETFRFSLSSAVNAVLSLNSSVATGTILDDDGTTAPAPATITYKVLDEWAGGFVADVAIKNNGTNPINGWTLEFDLAANIVNLWNAELVSRVGDRYTIRAVSWNQVIAPGATISFGFQGASSSTPSKLSNVRLNGAPIP